MKFILVPFISRHLFLTFNNQTERTLVTLQQFFKDFWKECTGKEYNAPSPEPQSKCTKTMIYAKLNKQLDAITG